VLVTLFFLPVLCYNVRSLFSFVLPQSLRLEILISCGPQEECWLVCYLPQPAIARKFKFIYLLLFIISIISYTAPSHSVFGCPTLCYYWKGKIYLGYFLFVFISLLRSTGLASLGWLPSQRQLGKDWNKEIFLLFICFGIPKYNIPS
jgi:hypothetical protein